MADQKQILVIKLSALGDFFQALGPMKSIKKHHPDTHITLLTTKSFKKLGEKCGYFNQIILDERPKWFQLNEWMKLRKIFIKNNFNRVYDLQNNDRTSFYFKMIPTNIKPEWVGVAKGASHENKSKERTASNAFSGHKNTLSLAGIENVETDKLEWMTSDLSKFNLPEKFAILITGSSPQHPEKRWPEKHYIDLCDHLISTGITPVIIGGPDEAETNKKIAESNDGIIDITGKTDLFDIAQLGRNAKFTIGNDTGPLHIISLTDCKTICFYCLKKSNPLKHTPLGSNTTTLEANDLNDVKLEQVIEKL